MELKIFNVGFGECSLLHENGHNLLIDFGSDAPDKKTKLDTAAKTIAASCTAQPSSALLTHFHDDHINGLLETNLSDRIKFDTVYIPDIFAQPAQNEQISYLQLILLHDIFQAIILKKGKSTALQVNLYSLLKKLVNAHSRVCFLKRGDSFSLADVNFEVLWPCMEALKISGKTVTRIKTALSDIGLIAVLQVGTPDDTSILNLGVIDQFGRKLADVYTVLVNGTDVPPNQMQELEETFQKVQIVTIQCANVFLNMSQSDKRQITALAKAMAKEGNKISIVFQDRAVQNCSKLLMTGDIPKIEFKKILEGKIPSSATPKVSKHYELIKAPHHGTDSHFVTILPDCNTIYASNGNTSHKKYGKITYGYGALYASNRNIAMHCTDQRCELYDLSVSGLGNKCSHCAKNVKTYNVINV